jgi:hypothetical protein
MEQMFFISQHFPAAASGIDPPEFQSAIAQ